MAKPILLDNFRSDAYSQQQLINDKLDLLIGEVRDMKQDIRDINARIDKLDKKIDSVEEKLDKKIDSVEEKLDKKIEDTRKELKSEIDKNRSEIMQEVNNNRSEIMQEVNNARWQIIALIVAQVVGVGAIVLAIVSALK